MEHKTKISRKTKISSPIQYRGNLFFLILFLIIWLPLGILLLLKHGSIASQTSRFYCQYHGSWNWLFFWGLLFFPIAVLLFLLKGVDVIEEATVEEETLIERY